MESEQTTDESFYEMDGPGLFGPEPDADDVAAAELEAERTVEVDTCVEPDLIEDPVLSAPVSELAAPAARVTPRQVQDTSGAPLALYRRYRPDNFADLIGQEHVSEPLQRALVNNRVNHAYLFSGPRGCGKTTSARILARCLNCEEGPTPTPCGVCQSCRDLARGGAGSIDVIEIDAASHGGVDDARELREKAFFAPVHSRYKIYIVDEAHMVTSAGFNALLKLVEEPPPHVKFIFATTEPEKVIGTIRSRTHHYPFRLVPPKVLTQYLATLCEAEGIAVEDAVLPLVVRAGAGSVRDSLSVLDQLLGGAQADGVGYAHAAGLLGFTPDSLLDGMIDAFAAGDGAQVFSTIDEVVNNGQDPKRFAEDLLTRLRDLVVVAAVPDAITSGLVAVAVDQAERMSQQAASMGLGELTRAAEVLSTGLTNMRGTTAPRLFLELMCARVLLPGADVDERGIHARLEKLERRLGMIEGGGAPSGAAAPTAPARGAAASASAARGAAPSTPTAPARTVPPMAETGLEDPSDRPVGRAAAARAAAEAAARAQAGPGSAKPPMMPVVDPVPAPPGWDDEPPMDEEREPQVAPPSRSTSGAPRGPEKGSQQPVSAPPAPPHAPAARPQQPPAAAPSADASKPRPDHAQAAPTSAPASNPAPGVLTTAQLRQVWPQIIDEVRKRRRLTWILLSQNSTVTDVSNGVLTLSMDSVGARDAWSRGGNDLVLRDSIVEVINVDLRIEAIAGGGGPAPGSTSSASAASVPRPTQSSPPAPVPVTPEDRQARAAAREQIAPTRQGPVERPDDDSNFDASDPDSNLEPVSPNELLRKELGAVPIQDA